MPKLCNVAGCNKYHSAKTRKECKACHDKMTTNANAQTNNQPLTTSSAPNQPPVTQYTQYSQFNPSSTSLFGTIGAPTLNTHQHAQIQQPQQMLSYAGLPQNDTSFPNISGNNISVNEARLFTLIQQAVKPLETKIDQIRDDLNNRVISLEKRMDLIEKTDESKNDELSKVKDTMVNMQRALNSFDSVERSKNIIISGLSEEVISSDNVDFDNDGTKLGYIFAKLGIDQNLIPEDNKIQRLGKDTHGTKRRFIKVEFDNKEAREIVMKQAPKLKDFPEPWKRIFINRDHHPVYQKEHQRLRKKFNDLKKEPQHQQNPGAVKLVKGTLSVNDVVIDKNMFLN